VTQPIIRIVDLWKDYSGDGTFSPALRGTNLEIKSGEIVALFGKSGSGKSTLFNLIAGLDRPTQGRIEVDGQDLVALGEKGRTGLRRLRLGFVFQFFNLLPTLTAFENVFLSLELADRPDPVVALTALKEVGLQSKEHRYPHELSRRGTAACRRHGYGLAHSSSLPTSQPENSTTAGDKFRPADPAMSKSRTACSWHPQPSPVSPPVSSKWWTASLLKRFGRVQTLRSRPSLVTCRESSV
jgi:hypothetical protein